MPKVLRDLSGLCIGKLTVLSYSHNRCGVAYWSCRCECGNEKAIAASNITRGNLRSCGCARYKLKQDNQNWKGCGDISSSLLCKIKSSANRRGIEFGLTVSYLWDLWKKQNGKCALSGLDLQLSISHIEISHGAGTASLDRIDSSKGYVDGNVQWVHKDVNFMKQQFTEDRFIQLCELIVENKRRAS